MDLTLALILIGLLAGLSLFLALQLVSLNAKNRRGHKRLDSGKGKKRKCAVAPLPFTSDIAGVYHCPSRQSATVEPPAQGL